MNLKLFQGDKQRLIEPLDPVESADRLQAWEHTFIKKTGTLQKAGKLHKIEQKHLKTGWITQKLRTFLPQKRLVPA